MKYIRFLSTILLSSLLSLNLLGNKVQAQNTPLGETLPTYTPPNTDQNIPLGETLPIYKPPSTNLVPSGSTKPVVVLVNGQGDCCMYKAEKLINGLSNMDVEFAGLTERNGK